MANLLNLTKHEMCMALARHDIGPLASPPPPPDAEFTSAYENWHKGWLAGYVFVKALSPTEALYLLAVNDDEGPNPYHGVCAGYAHLTLGANGEAVLRWADQESATP